MSSYRLCIAIYNLGPLPAGTGVSDRILRGKSLTIATGGTMPRGGIRCLRRCLDKFISPRMDSGLIIIRLHISRAVGRRFATPLSSGEHVGNFASFFVQRIIDLVLWKPRNDFVPHTPQLMPADVHIEIWKNVNYYLIIDVANIQEFFKSCNFIIYFLYFLNRLLFKVKQIIHS